MISSRANARLLVGGTAKTTATPTPTPSQTTAPEKCEVDIETVDRTRLEIVCEHEEGEGIDIQQVNVLIRGTCLDAKLVIENMPESQSDIFVSVDDIYYRRVRPGEVALIPIGSVEGVKNVVLRLFALKIGNYRIRLDVTS